MSRDQRPGKFKLVGAAAPNPGRRREDKLPEQPAAAAGAGNAALPGTSAIPATDAKASHGPVLVLLLLFLLCCALGGAGVVYFGLVGGMPQ